MITKKIDKNRCNANLFLMWLIISFGYLLFIWSWYYLGQVAGDFSYQYDDRFKGWSESFFVNSPGSLISNSTHWSITFIRAIGSIFAGWFLTKVGHKRAVCVALILMVLSFPFIIIAFPFSGNSLTLVGKQESDINVFGVNGQPIGTTNSIIGYTFFVLFRVFLAIGGTVLITYTQPIITKLPVEQKIKINRLNYFSFTIGALMATIFFIFSREFNNLLIEFWYIMSIILICFNICLVVLYLVFGNDVNINNVNRITQNYLKDHVTLLTMIKNKDTWKFGLLFGLFLFIVLFPMTGTIRSVIQTSPNNSAFLINAANKSFNESSFFWVWPIWQMLFLSGMFVGYFLISAFSTTKYDRKRFLAFTFFVGFLCLCTSLVFGYLGYSNPTLLVFHLFFIFLSGIFLWGSESVILTMPHELPNINPQKISVMFSWIWAIAYFTYTLTDIFLSLIYDLNVSTECNDAPTNCLNSSNLIVLILFACFIFLVLLFVSFLPKTGHYHGDRWIVNDKKWKIWNWNFKRSDVKIIDKNK